MILALIFSLTLLVSCNNKNETPLLNTPKQIDHLEDSSTKMDQIKEIQILDVFDESNLESGGILKANHVFLGGLYHYFKGMNSYSKVDEIEKLKYDSVSFYEAKNDGETKSFIFNFSQPLRENKISVYRINEFLDIEQYTTVNLVPLVSQNYIYKLFLKDMKKGIYVISVEGLEASILNNGKNIFLPNTYKARVNNQYPIYACDGMKLKFVGEMNHFSPTFSDKEMVVRDEVEIRDRTWVRQQVRVIGNMINRSRGLDKKRQATINDLMNFMNIDESINIHYGLSLIPQGEEIIFKAKNMDFKCDYVKLEFLKRRNYQSMRVGTITYLDNPVAIGEARQVENFETPRFIEVYDTLEMNGVFQIY